MGHFILSMVLLWNAAVLIEKAKTDIADPVPLWMGAVGSRPPDPQRKPHPLRLRLDPPRHRHDRHRLGPALGQRRRARRRAAAVPRPRRHPHPLDHGLHRARRRVGARPPSAQRRQVRAARAGDAGDDPSRRPGRGRLLAVLHRRSGPARGGPHHPRLDHLDPDRAPCVAGRTGTGAIVFSYDGPAHHARHRHRGRCGVRSTSRGR